MSKYKKNPPVPARPAAAATSASTASAPSPLSAAKPAAKLRSMEQLRAEFALKKIEEIARGDTERQIEVRRYLNNLPALIRMNGLGQALAFFRMKGEGSSHEAIYRIVGTWLCQAGSEGRVFDEDPDVLKAITQSDMHTYMAAQNEAQALLEWLKKFAMALLQKE